MIVVTRLNGSQFAMNPDLIERIAERPDTTITLVDGSTHLVEESMAVVMDRIADARAEVIARASLRTIELTPGQRHLSAVPTDDASPRK